jgi:Protein of unknown function (DUF2849)
MTSPLDQKIKITGPVVVTANRVGDGAVVYRRGRGWTTALGEADITTNATAARELINAAVADDRNAVGAYIAPVKLTGGGVEPGNLRESIRRDGPTIPLPEPFEIEDIVARRKSQDAHVPL